MATPEQVWKFPLPYKGKTQFEIEVPRLAKPLRVDIDPKGEVVLWAQVKPKQPAVRTVVTVVGTGQNIPDDAGEYISTFLMEMFVFHAYYRQDMV